MFEKRLFRRGGLFILVLTVLLAACDQIPVNFLGQEPTPTPVPVADDGPTIISATGEVVPEDEVSLSFQTAGQVIDVLIEEGDTVAAGDVIALLNADLIEADIEEAEAALAVAQAQLDQAKQGSRDQEIEQAEADVAAASASTAEAAANRDDVARGAEAQEIAQARSQLEAALNAQRSAQDTFNFYDFWANEATVDDFQERNDIPFQWPPPQPRDAENAQDALDDATRDLITAQAALDRLLAGPNPEELAIAEASVWVAAADREAAEAYLNLLHAGPRPEDITISEAAVAQAEAALEAALAAIDKTVLVAPFDGVITNLDVREGEWIAPGQGLVVMADLSLLLVETTDLNEIDVALVQIGDEVEIVFDALPELTIDGTVSDIALQASEGSQGNYTVTVELDEMPDALRWGMTAFVDIIIVE